MGAFALSVAMTLFIGGIGLEIFRNLGVGTNNQPQTIQNQSQQRGRIISRDTSTFKGRGTTNPS